MKKITKIIIAIVVGAAFLTVMSIDAKIGESQCGEMKFNQTTGECIAD